MNHLQFKFAILLITLLVSAYGCDRSGRNPDKNKVADTIMVEETLPAETMPDSMKNTRKTTYFAPNGVIESRRKFLEETFDSAGRLISETRYPAEGSPTTIAYSYDASNHVSKKLESGPNGSTSKEFENTYDAEGRIVKVQEKGTSISRKISYLDDGQRLEESFLGGSLQQRIVYDSNDKPLHEFSPGTNIGIVRVYDEFGNPIEERTEFVEAHDVRRFQNQYDDEGRLIEARLDGKLYLQQTFDTEGRLIERKEYGFGSELMGVWEYVYEKIKP